MQKKMKFTFPKHLLNQIEECTNGYFLVTLNDELEFEVYQDLKNPAVNLGMLNFLEIYSTSAQQNIRDKSVNQLGEAETEDGDEGAGQED